MEDQVGVTLWLDIRRGNYCSREHFQIVNIRQYSHLSRRCLGWCTVILPDVLWYCLMCCGTAWCTVVLPDVLWYCLMCCGTAWCAVVLPDGLFTDSVVANVAKVSLQFFASCCALIWQLILASHIENSLIMVKKVVLGRGFLRVLRFYPVSHFFTHAPYSSITC
jgi:hypothetical protein